MNLTENSLILLAEDNSEKDLLHKQGRVVDGCIQKPLDVKEYKNAVEGLPFFLVQERRQ